MRPTQAQIDADKVIWPAEYISFSFPGDYSDGLISGMHIDNDFTETDLTGAELHGTYINCTFNSTINNARIYGRLIGCTEGKDVQV